MLSRRTFVSWLSGLGTAIGLGVRQRASAVVAAEMKEAAQPAVLDAVIVTRIGEVVLPSELGDAGIGRVSRAFTTWIGSYRASAELVHPYGSDRIQMSGPSPATRWRSQLQALERDARSRHGRGFLAITRDQRRDLIAAALEGERSNRIPDPLSANHVAAALAAWFYSSPEATDLCYQARIGRQSCRPLINAPRVPLPLANRPT